MSWPESSRHVRRGGGVATAFALLLAVGCSHKSVEEVETNAPVPVVVEAAKIDLLRSTFSAAGTVVPAPGADMIVLAPEHARIAELPKAEGEVVREGDILVRFDIPTLPADLAAKKAAVNQAQAHIDAAAAAVARLTGLVAKGVAAPREVEEAKRTQAEADAELAQARSAVDAATSLADRAVVRATFSGVVAKRWHNPGDIVEAAASDPILRIVNPEKLQIVAAVPSADLPRVVPGHDADVHVVGREAAEPAKVLMRPAQVDPVSGTADVRLAFAKPTSLPVGTAVQVDIVGEVQPKALVVPAAAIVHDEDETFVMVAGADNKAHKYPVAMGLSTHDFVQITSGDLKPGDRVIVRGQTELPEGATITISK
jgi:RND family efflux transporter MFP subunit